MDKWVILMKEDCKWCRLVKQLLHDNDIEFLALDVNDKPGLRDFLIGSRLPTVPQVYKNGNRIGGYDQTRIYLEGL